MHIYEWHTFFSLGIKIPSFRSLRIPFETRCTRKKERLHFLRWIFQIVCALLRYNFAPISPWNERKYTVCAKIREVTISILQNILYQNLTILLFLRSSNRGWFFPAWIKISRIAKFVHSIIIVNRLSCTASTTFATIGQFYVKENEV